MVQRILLFLLVLHLSRESCLAVDELIKTSLTKQDIFNCQKIICQDKSSQFSNDLLAYITPWNKEEGMKTALEFAHKITYLSPAWYQFKLDHNQQGALAGSEHYDEDFLEEIKGLNPKMKIVPLIKIQVLKEDDLYIFSSKEKSKQIAKRIHKYLKYLEYDGAILEFGHLLTREYGTGLATFGRLVQELFEESGMIVGVTTVVDSENYISSKVFSLLKNIHFWNMMAYDYPKWGANAPISWAKKGLKNLKNHGISMKKVILGLPFYGYQYSKNRNPTALGGIEFTKMLELQPDLIINYDENNEEFSVETGGYPDNKFELAAVKGKTIYPTPWFLKKRIELCEKEGCGIGIWELGLGLECFMHIF